MGTWLLTVRVLADELWQQVKTGEIASLSLRWVRGPVPRPA
jgi:hypothetical protein